MVVLAPHAAGAIVEEESAPNPSLPARAGHHMQPLAGILVSWSVGVAALSRPLSLPSFAFPRLLRIDQAQRRRPQTSRSAV